MLAQGRALLLASAFWSALGTRLAALILVICGLWALLLIPNWGDYLFAGGELVLHVRQAASAKAMLETWQFPLTYSNDAELSLQPAFLYYTPVWYCISVAAQILLDINSSNGILVVYGICFTVAVSGLVRLLTYFRVNFWIALVCAVLYCLSPYFLTDVYERFAINEVSVFALLPVTLFCLVRLWDEGSVRWILINVVSLTFFVLAHKIFIAWFYTLAIIFLIGKDSLPWRVIIYRAGLISFCFGAAMLLSAPYWFTSLANFPRIQISEIVIPEAYLNAGLLRPDFDGTPTPVSVGWSWLTADDFFVLSPFPHFHPIAGYLHLQIGAAVLIALILTLVLRIRERVFVSLALVTVISILFVTSVWYLFPLWKYMLTPWTIVQFPYRLLIFVTLFGTFLFGMVMQWMLDRGHWIYWIATYFALSVACVLALPFVLLVYDPPKPGLLSSAVESAVFVRYDFREFGPDTVPSEAPLTQLPRSSPNFSVWGNRARAVLQAADNEFVRLPILYSNLLRGTDNGVPIAKFYKSGDAAVVFVSSGSHELVIDRLEARLAWLMLLVGIGCLALSGFAARILRRIVLGRGPPDLHTAGT